MDSKSRVQLQDYTAAYLDCGSGQTIIFLHGFFGEGRSWRALMEQLSGQDCLQYRCIALDLLGFGESSQPRLRYTIWHQVSFLQQFIAALGLEKVTLVGHSYGGWTAAAFALQQPMALERLILIAPAGIRDDSFVGRYNHLRPLLWESPLVDWGLSAIRPLAILSGNRAAFTQAKQARTELLRQPVAKSFLVDRLRPEDAIDTVEKEIHQIQVPTLVIVGEKDSTIPLWHCQTYAQEIQGAKIEVLADAEHDLIQTHDIDGLGDRRNPSIS
jgi:pimeloyl-ACP methyl ester carboxylesterase